MTNKTYTIWRATLIAGMVVGLAGVIGEMVWSADNGKLSEGEVITMATSAKITIEGAVETALENIAGQVIVAELEMRGDKIVWNVDILTADAAIMTVYVDAVSGSVMMTKEKVAGERPVQAKTS
ncbi:MAG: PepSY domain-containing protein [Nitrospira sp.]|nr:PepSY domain-containing protein [Nitrospira sp.]MDH4369095.1 PepSY domain-containing protein [Nitrospira sp.]MDH5348125.1 PepSY domain-containing protein [Nitrospira sp.]MDH5496700.1 PepSY domain-containing protein [Nitrospira sp.]MDH5726671.1 PepSY domain-containing protein [Nitrospira sp.]